MKESWENGLFIAGLILVFWGSRKARTPKLRKALQILGFAMCIPSIVDFGLGVWHGMMDGGNSAQPKQ